MYAKTEDRTHLLRACYANALRVADELGAATVAFPLISSGVYRWPRRDAVYQALDTLRGAHTAVAAARLVLYDAATREVADEVHRAL